MSQTRPGKSRVGRSQYGLVNLTADSGRRSCHQQTETAAQVLWHAVFRMVTFPGEATRTGKIVVANHGPAAIWAFIQPLRDPDVGAVSATVLPRNAFTNLVTWFQAYEYLNTI